jgi:hypothetical protein
VAADFKGLALYRIARDGRHLGAFGSGAIAQELAAARARQEAARDWKHGAWAGLVLTLLVGMTLAWRFSERPAWRPAKEPRADTAAAGEDFPAAPPVELAPGSWFVQRLLVAQGIVLLLMAATIALGLVPRWPGVSAAGRWWLAAAGALAIAVSLAAAWVTWRFGQLRLRLADGRIAVLQDGRARVEAGLGSVLASQRSLLVGTEVLPYRTTRLPNRPGRWIFDEEALARGLLDRLAPEQHVSDAELGRERMRRLPRWQWAVLVLSIAAALAYSLWVVLR